MMLGKLKPVAAFFVALGVGLTPLSAVYAAAKSDAGSSSVSRAKQPSATKKKQVAPSAVRRPAVKSTAAGKVNKVPAVKKAPVVKAVPLSDARRHEERLLDVRSGAALVVELTGGGRERPLPAQPLELAPVAGSLAPALVGAIDRFNSPPELAAVQQISIRR